MEDREVYVLDTIGFISHLLDVLPHKPKAIVERAIVVVLHNQHNYQE